MAKKKSHKKHQFKYGQPSASVMQAKASPGLQPMPQDPVTPKSASVTVYVLEDVKRIAILAAGCLVLELVLWYLMNRTGVGPAVYSHVIL